MHSAKDVPSELAPGTAIVAAPRRADPLDVLVGEKLLADVREAARVGTSALRRRAQLLAVRPDLRVVELRGQRRHAAAQAGGRRGRRAGAGGGRPRPARPPARRGRSLFGHVFVPAPGQGVIAVQAREGSPAADVAASVSHGRTMACLRTERAAVRELAASCHTPVGVHADGVTIRGFAGLPDGSEWIVDEVAMDGDGAAPTLARRMLAAGAGDLLREAEAMAAR